MWAQEGSVDRGWRNAHNEEVHNLYWSQNTIGMLKTRKMGWAGRMGEMRNAYTILVGNPDG
jgi:hypothetical protein